MCDNRQVCVSGGFGPAPAFHAWTFGEEPASIQRVKLPKGAKEISACAISPDGTIMGCVDKTNDHNVFFYKVDDGSLLFKDSGDKSNKIVDMAFSKKQGDYYAATVGEKHMMFWKASDGPKKIKSLKGDFMKKIGRTGDNMMTCTFDINGNCYTGG